MWRLRCRSSPGLSYGQARGLGGPLLSLLEGVEVRCTQLESGGDVEKVGGAGADGGSDHYQINSLFIRLPAQDWAMLIARFWRERWRS
jgi:hypothetical protein